MAGTRGKRSGDSLVDPSSPRLVLRALPLSVRLIIAAFFVSVMDTKRDTKRRGSIGAIQHFRQADTLQTGICKPGSANRDKIGRAHV